VCTLAIYVRSVPEFPLIVAANRDEFLARPTSPPRLLDSPADVFGGRDEVAGGTWLAVNRAGVVAALLNRRTDEPADPRRRSRGRLCLDMLQTASAAEARTMLQRQSPEDYNPFNLLVADRHDAWVATNHGRSMAVTALERALHVITNLDVDDPRCPRIAASYQLFAGLIGEGAPAPASSTFRDRLRQILARHDTELDPRTPSIGNSLCVHSEEYGTRSSTLIFLDRTGRWTYFHANDAPCRRDYEAIPAMEALCRS